MTVSACHRQAAEFYYLGFVESATTDFIADSYCQRFTDSEVKAFCGLTNHWRISESQCVVYLFFLTWSTAQTPQTIVNAPIYIPRVARLYSSDYRPLGTVNFTHSHRTRICNADYLALREVSISSFSRRLLWSDINVPF